MGSMGVGPVMEDDPVEIRCETQGGRPTPQVTWWRAGKELPATTNHDDKSSWAVITLEATRDLLRVPLLCHASIDHPPPTQVRPRTTAVTVDITRKISLLFLLTLMG